jgi:hypothetical protein
VKRCSARLKKTFAVDGAMGLNPYCLVACLVWSALMVGGPAMAAEKPIDFNRQIRPILSDACFKCHGFDEQTRQGGLRLDTLSGATAKLDSGVTAIVPGDTQASALVERITAGDASLRMPPADGGKTLSPQQIELLVRWVEQGAKYESHWSFIPPMRPEAPQVKAAESVANAIDAFVIARLEREGLPLTPQADRVTLVRRASYDLTGLPPTPAEVDAFLADSSPVAYEKLVDRLLASPRYGQHKARYWLDAVRYADTHGLHYDNERSLWPYRDWVVEAFNANMPFDQFTIEQLAGDLLPEATIDQRIATGFIRCNLSTSEGGSIDEEVLVRYGVDRVEATSTVFMGLTMGCAVCHDHKFDPVTQRDFYGLMAFFNGIAERAMDGNALSPPPLVRIPTAENAAELKQIEDNLAALERQASELLKNATYVDPAPQRAGEKPQPREFVWIDDELPAGAKPETTSGPWQFVFAADGPVLQGEKSSTRTAKGLSQHFFTGAQQGLKLGAGDTLFAYVYLDRENPPRTIMLQFNDGSWEHRAVWGEDLIDWGKSGTASRQLMGPLPQPGEWVRLEVSIDKVGLKKGSTVNGWAFTQFDGQCYWDRAGIVTRTLQEGMRFESQAEWETFSRGQLTAQLLKQPPALRNALKFDVTKRDDEQQRLVRDFFLQYYCQQTDAEFGPLNAEIARWTAQRAELDQVVPTSMVAGEMLQPRDTFVLLRGAYDKKGDEVAPGVPAVLPPLPEGAPANRLGLAQWLVHPSHPLTARVTVNRFWQQYFGTGLVKTAEDFGSQGSWPTHPGLLDWLATEFVESGWDVKRIQKLIVMSNTYRQSSKITPDSLARDPDNALLARGPRFRLDAEMIRDTSLAASGLLVETRGGRGVRPYQPDGIWEAVAYVGSNTQKYQRDEGEGLYRRSLYTFWKRTAPPASLTTFDAPSREACVVRRSRTNTPLQALVLMNDVQYVEAARKLAERVIHSTASPPERLKLAFRLAACRQLDEEELAVLAQTLDAYRRDYEADAAAAEKLASVGESKRDESIAVSELAAYTMVCNLILNLDEVVTKE